MLIKRLKKEEFPFIDNMKGDFFGYDDDCLYVPKKYSTNSKLLYAILNFEVNKASVETSKTKLQLFKLK